MGKSGVAAARLCLARGALVTGVDRKAVAELGDGARAFVEAGGAVAPEAERDARVASADLVIVSPGVASFPALDAAAARGTPVWSEVELACRELASRDRASVIAVGGTNGKSTTTTLIGALLESTGARTFTGGNLGEPLSACADAAWDHVVLEVSSFQMERLDAFAPHVAILLNVTPDHLDRYASLEAYAAAKGNAFVRQTARDVAIVPAGDAVCLPPARRGQARIVTFGPGGDVDVTGDAVIDRASGVRFERSGIALEGTHNAMNVAAAWAAVRELGVSAADARRVLSGFQGLAHRMALVAELGGIRFYDDSKGTNVGASVTALLGLREPRAVLIAGGVEKGGRYVPLVHAMQARARAAVLIGEAAGLIEGAVAGRVPVRRAASMDEAVRASFELARPGDAVLLSPACSSFDMFRDYKDRGDAFVGAVRKLKEEKSS
jgi:UDP-N-acetylmuramoylalanine--D-glutamate ligase